MNPNYLYLTLDILAIFVPFIFSFYPKANFSKQWKYLWLAILVPGIMFIVWDEIFTRLGIWGFNSTYLTGAHIGSLPLEEILFFICIPYACVFTYEALNYLIERDILQSHQKLISVGLIAMSMAIGLSNADKWYTFTAFTGLSIVLFLFQFVWKVSFLSRFYLTFFVILVPFFLINGILTGSWIDEPVVWYNNAENLGIRIGTIPVEDIFYGMLLLVLNVSIFEWIRQGKR